jgi:hypothetical protein
MGLRRQIARAQRGDGSMMVDPQLPNIRSGSRHETRVATTGVRSCARPAHGMGDRRWQVSWLAARSLPAPSRPKGQWLGADELAAYSCGGSHGLGSAFGPPSRRPCSLFTSDDVPEEPTSPMIEPEEQMPVKAAGRRVTGLVRSPDERARNATALDPEPCPMPPPCRTATRIGMARRMELNGGP